MKSKLDDPLFQHKALNELDLLSRFDHPSIIKYVEHVRTDTDLRIVLEYADCGDLRRFIDSRENRPIPEHIILTIFSQICLGLQFLHSHHVLDRDFKPDNILMMSDGTIRNCDFDSSKLWGTPTELVTDFVGTSNSMSPELCVQEPYSYPSDIWALGRIVYELYDLHKPFNGKNSLSILLCIVSGGHPPLSQTVNLNLRNLVDRMLSKDSLARPTINPKFCHQQCFQHCPKFPPK
jgi:NIMA (never in mitosis gene a)-related kinase